MQKAISAWGASNGRRWLSWVTAVWCFTIVVWCAPDAIETTERSTGGHLPKGSEDARSHGSEGNGSKGTGVVRERLEVGQCIQAPDASPARGPVLHWRADRSST